MNREIPAVGIDMSKGMITEAHSHVPTGMFVQMDIRHLAFPQGCFGGIWACAVLVHIPPYEIAPTLKSFYRVLENEGILFIAIHESQNSSLPEERISEDGRYFVSYSEQTIRQELLNSGFTSITTKRQVSFHSTYGNMENAIHWLNILTRK
jgi:trans-aconitate methyltransferase